MWQWKPWPSSYDLANWYFPSLNIDLTVLNIPSCPTELFFLRDGHWPYMKLVALEVECVGQLGVTYPLNLLQSSHGRLLSCVYYSEFLNSGFVWVFFLSLWHRLMANDKIYGLEKTSGSRIKDPGRDRVYRKHTWCSASTFKCVANFFCSWAEVLTSLSLWLLNIELCKIFLLFRNLWHYRCTTKSFQVPWLLELTAAVCCNAACLLLIGSTFDL